MNRKEFLKSMAAVAGGLAVPSVAESAGLDRLLQDADARGDAAFWKVVRQQFNLERGWTFLNFGNLGACPLPVLNSFAEWSRTEELAPSAGYDSKVWASVKDRLAGLLGTCTKDDLALIGCATEGVNIIVNGLPLQKGDEVITSTHEHAAVNTALLSRMKRDGIVVKLFDPDPVRAQGNVERIAQLTTPKTRLIILSHVLCSTGLVFPVKDIAKFARDRKIWFALDGAQAPVCTPFDIADTGADFYTCSTHKWLMGPKRTGFLYVRPGMLDTLQTHTIGMGSTKSNSIATGELVLHPTAQRFEYGTQNDALFFALGTAVDFVQAIGIDRIQRYCRSMSERFYRDVQKIPGVEVASPQEPAYRSLMISFKMAGKTSAQIMEHLTKEKIRVRPVSEGGLNGIRVSFYICNQDSEVTQILDALAKLS